jgi:hypothetical protein
MIQLNLTPQETILLYGFLEGMIDKIESVEDQLNNPELTISLIESIGHKIATQLENQTTNN